MSQLPPLYKQADWVGLKSVVMVVRVRHPWNKTTREVHFISLESDAQKLGRAIRQHWGIENKLHWTIDVTFEDACRIRTGHAPQNLSLLRRIALNALNRENPFGAVLDRNRTERQWKIITCSKFYRLVYPQLMTTQNLFVNRK